MFERVRTYDKLAAKAELLKPAVPAQISPRLVEAKSRGLNRYLSTNNPLIKREGLHKQEKENVPADQKHRELRTLDEARRHSKQKRQNSQKRLDSPSQDTISQLQSVILKQRLRYESSSELLPDPTPRQPPQVSEIATTVVQEPLQGTDQK